MSSSMLRLAFLPVLLAGLVLSACERVELPGAASDPQLSARALSAHRKVPGKAPQGSATVAAAVIGAAGGSVELAGHRLIVPAGAVAHPTRFSLTLVENGFVEVDLRAARSSAAGTEVDVGKQGFARPVTLQLSYERAEQLADPTGLVVAWVRPDGSLQPLRSSHDASQRAITAELDHFSPYVLATP